MSKIFVDTNILVYAFDNADPIRKKAARHALQRLEKEGNGVISTQVLQEFYVACTQKLKADPINTKAALHSMRHFEVVMVTPELIENAADCSILKRLSFWDSLIVVCAEQAECQILWSEDLQENQIIRGVKIVNPLN